MLLGFDGVEYKALHSASAIGSVSSTGLFMISDIEPVLDPRNFVRMRTESNLLHPAKRYCAVLRFLFVLSTYCRRITAGANARWESLQ